MLFFSSLGQVYKLKVWRLPIAEPQGRGRALINILPLDAGETISSIMPLPEDEAAWQKLDIMFATRSGGVRRNSLADFVEINKNGKIAMKLDEGDAIVGVETCSANDDVLLTTSLGQAIRFQVDEVRASSRGATRPACAASRWPRATRSSPWRSSTTSTRHPAEREAYLKQ